mgnify:CR=1 FL=1
MVGVVQAQVRESAALACLVEIEKGQGVYFQPLFLANWEEVDWLRRFLPLLRSEPHLVGGIIL